MNRRLVIDIQGHGCAAILQSVQEDGSTSLLAHAGFEMQHGIHSWSRLLNEVHDELKLDTFTPPGMPTEGGKTCRDPFEVWQVVRCDTPDARGWGWGFMLPFDATLHQVPIETCCGFRDQAAAVKAAKTLKHNHSRITGILPGCVFSVFVLDGVYAFLDHEGEIHATFPTRAEAQGCASKMEAAQEDEHFQEEAPSQMLSQ